MLKSMTAYGRCQEETALGRFLVEIQCVNRKHLEINLSIPKELCRFDSIIRKWIARYIHRGQVNVRIIAYYDGRASLKVVPNLCLAEKVYDALTKISNKLDLEEKIGIESLIKYPDLLVVEEINETESEYQTILENCFVNALEILNSMRVQEGQVIENELRDRVEVIRKQIDFIESKTAKTVSIYREKLKKRLENVLKQSTEDDRVLKEICIFADRVAIDEEILRLRSHLDQCEFLLKSDRVGLGKTIDFLTQELAREAGTIASKLVDVEASNSIVEMKGEIEKIRQQVQNIE